MHIHDETRIRLYCDNKTILYFKEPNSPLDLLSRVINAYEGYEVAVTV